MSENELQKMPVDLIAMAIEKGADIAQLEKLMEMQARWEQKEASKHFKVAFTEFQGKKPVLLKTSKVDFVSKTAGKVNYSFASLPSLQRSVDPILSECGLSYRWEQQENDGRIEITCIVSHISGHSEYTSLSAPLDNSGSKNAIQSIGSTVSYLKRYTLEGALGLSSDKDTDAVTSIKREEMTPEHPRWEHAVTAAQQGKINAVKKKYEISEENEVKLLKP